MTQRRYGPVKGAGTTVTELEGSRQITAGELGYCAYAGMFEKGPVGDLTIARTAKEFNKIMGSYYSGTLAPDACEHFYAQAAGAGGLALVRVTDGNEVQAQTTLWNRNGDLRESMGVLKAKNGGKWGGAALKFRGLFDTDAATDLTATTVDTGEAGWATNELAGGYIEFDEIANTQYTIASNTSAGVITVLDGYDMLADYDAADVSNQNGLYVVLSSGSKEITYQIGDGEDTPASEFSLAVFVDGVEARRWGNLSTDPASARYWVSAVNDDDFNYYVEAVDGWDGKPHTAGARPANHYAKATAITETLLTAEIIDAKIGASVGGSVTTIAAGTTTDVMVPQTLTCTAVDATSFNISSDVFGALVDDSGVAIVGLFDGTAIAPNNKFVPAFELTAASMLAAETIIIQYRPFVVDQLIGGFVFPDKAGDSTTKFRITDNSHNTITVGTGYDMTVPAPLGTEYFAVEAPLPLSGGRDGNADVVDADFVLQAWDIDTSPFNKMFGQNLGLVKMAAPGWDGSASLTSAIDVAGLAYATAKNYMYRAEIPIAVVDENEAVAHINSTIGRSDFLVASFPSWGYVLDPEAPGENKLKQVPLTGKINGRESLIAKNYDGYHKAAAGIDAILSGVLKLTTGTAVLDEEILNPAGLSVIVKKQGNFVIWGDRTCYSDQNWKWKHQRELMSHYEHVLQENFDWIIFAINDPETDALAMLTLQTYFLPEWQPKRAIRGNSFDDAAIFKLDDENNTDATRAAGDLNVEIQLRLADTVERFNIFIGKQGIFESVG